MISPGSSSKVTCMQEGGKKLWQILQTLLSESQTGVSLQTIEDHAQHYIKEAGGTPSFSTVKGYTWATCLCINDQVVHGIPSPYVLRNGDVFTIDVGMVYKGFHTDTAWTKIIGGQKTEDEKQKEYIPGITEVPPSADGPGMKSETVEEKERFLRVGEETLEKAIKVAKAGHHIGDISYAIYESITNAGYSIIPSLTGHGVGRTLHEEPMIPGYLDKPVEKTPLIVPGMTLAIEIIYAMGKGAIVYPSDDGWTLASKDRSLTAVFEKTIGVLDGETLVLTGS